MSMDLHVYPGATIRPRSEVNRAEWAATVDVGPGVFVASFDADGARVTCRPGPEERVIPVGTWEQALDLSRLLAREAPSPGSDPAWSATEEFHLRRAEMLSSLMTSRGDVSVFAELLSGTLLYVVRLVGRKEPLISTPHHEEALHVFRSVKPGLHWDKRWMPRGFNGQDPDRDVSLRVFSAGMNPEGCVRGLADSLGSEDVQNLAVEFDEKGGWSATWTQDGDGLKAWGVIVPGGAVTTGWK